MTTAPGKRFRLALKNESPLQIPGVINAYCALLAERAGFQALYLSGAGVANASHGIPDLGMTSLEDVVTEVKRITAVTELPLLVDIDTGWETTSGLQATVKSLELAGAAALHIEDQVAEKRCGHRPGKSIVTAEQMTDRIKGCLAARTDSELVIMARTDALAVEGLDATIHRCQQYVAAGADMIFAEAIADLEQYQKFTSAVDVPVLANMTEFGQSPLLSTTELQSAGVQLVLYPLSAFRAMSATASAVFNSIRKHGTQAQVVDQMQTRDELYDVLNYHYYEQQIDQGLKKD